MSLVWVETWVDGLRFLVGEMMGTGPRCVVLEFGCGVVWGVGVVTPTETDMSILVMRLVYMLK
jgi:hypothetical protein